MTDVRKTTHKFPDPRQSHILKTQKSSHREGVESDKEYKGSDLTEMTFTGLLLKRRLIPKVERKSDPSLNS